MSDATNQSQQSSPLMRLIVYATMFFALYYASKWWTSPSFVQLEPEAILSNEDAILADVYWDFSETNKYKNGHKMNPPFVFDQVYAICLNLNSGSIDSLSLNDEDSELDIEWDDWDLDMEGLRDMISAKTPIVELNMHWIDPMSQTGNNGWATYTYFYPHAKMADGKFELGNRYKVESNITGLKYFPYFHDDPYSAPFGGGVWMNLKDESVLNQKIMFNGGITTVGNLIKP
jgi:hypothetical protein